MMSKNDFERILERYLNGTANAQERKWIEKWYSSLESENNYPELNAAEEQFLYRADLESIQKRIKGKKRRIIALWPSLAAAAAVIIGILFIYKPDVEPGRLTRDNKNISSIQEEIVNRSTEVKVVRLSDSSQVLLQPNSTIWIADGFNKEDRRISLEGEAFFDVAHDENRPFKVYTHDVVTTVLGTSFDIKAPSVKERITVVVRTGRVVVSSNTAPPGDQKVESQEVIVTPNQQAVFNPESKVLEAALVQNPVTVNKPDKTETKEVFDGEPIVNILQKIELLYAVEIQYDEAVLANCRITTAFLKEGLYERLDVLSKAIGATYAIEGTQIIFKSKGCSINQ